MNPTIYSGQKITAIVSADRGNKSPAKAAIFIRHYAGMNAAVETRQINGEAIELAPGSVGKIELTVPDTAGGFPVYAVGLSVNSADPGAVRMDSMDWSGPPKIAFRPGVYRPGYAYPYGWTISGKPAATLRAHDELVELLANTGITTLSTGTAEWSDYSVSADVLVRIADSAGIAARYSGVRRYIALEYRWKSGEIQLVRRHDDSRRALASAKCGWNLNEFHNMKLVVNGRKVAAYGDGKKLFEESFRGLPSGGIALLSAVGSAQFKNIQLDRS
jgi:hypothetical protein